MHILNSDQFLSSMLYYTTKLNLNIRNSLCKCPCESMYLRRSNHQEILDKIKKIYSVNAVVEFMRPKSVLLVYIPSVCFWMIFRKWTYITTGKIFESQMHIQKSRIHR
jgi:hypothetical protein